jgi:N-acetylneuraminate synthase
MFEKVFIIAEAGSNHNGNLDFALELVHQAKKAGADAIKFQDFSLHSLFSVEHYAQTLGFKNQSWQKEITAIAFNPKWHAILANEAIKSGITYFSTPFSLDAVEFLNPHVPFFKIASCDITNGPLLHKVGLNGKGVFLSTGVSTLEEIDRAVHILEGYDLPFLCIMHCIMMYPTPDEFLNLNFIETLSKRYEHPVGFSDHSMGLDAAVLSVARGARALEKHFTLSRDLEGSDHRNSLTPGLFSRLVNKIRTAEKMLGSSVRVITEKEAGERVYARRGVYAARDLKQGEKLTLENVALLRPNIVVGAEHVDKLLGKKLRMDVAKGTPLEFSMVT